MASRRPRLARMSVSAERRDRWRRSVLAGQGIYYVLVGLWPLLHFSSFASFVALPMNPFQAQVFGAVILVVGASLAEAARREPPGTFPTLLGTAVASAIALVSLFWLPRSRAVGGIWLFGEASGLWIDVLIEVAIAAALVLFYPRPLPERGRTTTRRR